MKPINYKALGAKIKEYRKKENITQEQLAEMADILQQEDGSDHGTM